MKNLAFTYNGTLLNLVFLGKGLFSTAYRNMDNLEEVFVFVKDREENTDPAKESLADYTLTEKETKEGFFEEYTNLHIPEMEFVTREYTIGRTNYQVFKTKFYEKLTAKNKQAWQDYKTLKKNWEPLLFQRKTIYQKRDEFYKIIKPLISENLFEAIQAIEHGYRNFGEGMFEFSPRNLKVDNAGNLILLDIIFDNAKAERIRKKIKVNNRY